jgi:hypothetical protein
MEVPFMRGIGGWSDSLQQGKKPQHVSWLTPHPYRKKSLFMMEKKHPTVFFRSPLDAAV